MEQRAIDWDRASFEGACRLWRMTPVEIELFCLALGRVGRQVEIERETCWRIDEIDGAESSLRGVAKILDVSHEAVRKALQRLEGKGLATCGRDGGGTVVVLCVARLFDAPPEPPPPKKPVTLPPRGCQPAVNSPATASSVPLEEESSSLRSSVSVNGSVSVEARRVPYNDAEPGLPPNFFRRTDLLPWDRERLTDADLRTLDLRMLRKLFAEAVRTKRAGKGDAKAFLAAAYHCAKHPGVAGWRAKCFCGRVKNNRYRGLTDAAWDWAEEILELVRDGRSIEAQESLLEAYR